jgi:hypothetical protein
MAADSPPLEPPGAVEIPGVVGAADEVVVRLVHREELRRAGLAEDHRSRGSEARYGGGVACGAVTSAEVTAAESWVAFDVEAVFDRDRNSGEWAGLRRGMVCED